MKRIALLANQVARVLSGRWGEGIALLLVRIALAGVFWRSGRSKVVEGSWLEISDTTRFLFENDYSGVPLPPALAAVAATWSEHLFPVLLVAGLATRLSAAALLGMTLVIQFFVFPEAWWSVHIVWVAMAAILISRGGGQFALDRLMPWGRARA